MNLPRIHEDVVRPAIRCVKVVAPVAMRRIAAAGGGWRRGSIVKRVLFTVLMLFLPGEAAAAVSGRDPATHQATMLVIQVPLILFATWLGGRLALRARLPDVVGQILAGMAIGPFALGGIPFAGFPDGVFPVAEGAVSVGPMLYSLSIIAAILLLFLSGLETDLDLFIRYAIKGGVIGVGGVVASFVTGTWLMSWYLGAPFHDPTCLFMGTLSVATSIGITALLLSRQRKIDSPEGTVILAAAVVDDILGIIILSVVLGVASIEDGGQAGAGQILGILGKALGVWILASVVGLRFGRQIGRFLKNTIHDRRTLAVIALGMALLLAGVFELAGLSVIIGAYVMGLTLSNTDLAFLIQARMRTLRDFFVPIFFAVCGMMFHFGAVANWEVVGFGLLFTVVAVLAKLVGSGGPALAMNFTFTGAMRIGWGMVPRGEVALIVASLGLAGGILNETVFGIALLMTIATTILAPPILGRYLRSPRPGLRTESGEPARKTTVIPFPNSDLAEMAVNRFLAAMGREGFFISKMEYGDELYQLRKDDVFITLSIDASGEARFITEEKNAVIFHTFLLESLLKLGEAVSALKGELLPLNRAAAVSQAAISAQLKFDLNPCLDPGLVKMRLESGSKPEIVRELVGILGLSPSDAKCVIEDVLERERSMSTGMQRGIAIPHARSAAIDQVRIVVGLKPDGVDFNALDGQPSRIFVLLLSSRQGAEPHLQLLSVLASRLSDPGVSEAVLAASTPEEITAILGQRT